MEKKAKSSDKDFEIKTIGDVLNDFKIITPPQKEAEVIIGNEDGEPRCRFDMFVRWPHTSTRRKKTFTYRGDYDLSNPQTKISDPEIMLWNLVRIFKNNYHGYLLAEMYDNTIPKSDERRLILRFKVEKNGEKKILSRLKAYEELLKDRPVPEWLK